MTSTRSRFAFLIHPRTDIASDLALANPLLGKIPNRWYEWLLSSLPIRPWVQNRIIATDTGEVLGECIVVPLTPAQLLGRDRKLVEKRIGQAIDLAQRRGADLVGLGALTAPATGGGQRLQSRSDIGVTNGNAFTAAATVQAIKRVARTLKHSPTIALVGATGSVGAAVTRRLALDGIANQLILVGRNEGRLKVLAENCGSQPVAISTEMSSCKDAHIVVLMTSATEALLHGEHLRTDAIVIDDTQPRNSSPQLLIERPDVSIIDGGLVMTPGLKRLGRAIGIPADTSFACLAETALLALSGHRGHGIIGKPDAEQVAQLQSLADSHSHLGFHLAEPTAFGEPVHIPGWAT